MRLVFDGIKKIKPNQQVDVLSYGNPSNNNLGIFSDISLKSQQRYFLSQETFNIPANEKFKTIFKKINSNKNHQNIALEKKDLSQEKKSQETYVRKHLVKTHQIAVIHNDIKLPVAPILRIALFQLKKGSSLNLLQQA